MTKKSSKQSFHPTHFCISSTHSPHAYDYICKHIFILSLSIESGFNRTRRQLTSTLPTSNLFDISPGYQTTVSAETLSICDKMFARKKRMLIFSSPKQLNLLFEGSMTVLDGTFKATPSFFDQIFTIHCLKFDCDIN